MLISRFLALMTSL